MTVFHDFVVILERSYKIRVCIIQTDFSGFESDAAAEYFRHTSFAWEPYIQNAQQRYGVVKRHMRTFVEGARAQMIDANLLIKLSAESINTMIYIKNRSPAPAVHKGSMTPIQYSHRGDLSYVDHIRIFGSETCLQRVRLPAWTNI